MALSYDDFCKSPVPSILLSYLPHLVQLQGFQSFEMAELLLINCKVMMLCVPETSKKVTFPNQNITGLFHNELEKLLSNYPLQNCSHCFIIKFQFLINFHLYDHKIVSDFCPRLLDIVLNSLIYINVWGDTYKLNTWLFQFCHWYYKIDMKSSLKWSCWIFSSHQQHGCHRIRVTDITFLKISHSFSSHSWYWPTSNISVWGILQFWIIPW